MPENRRYDSRFPCLDVSANVKIGEDLAEINVFDISRGGVGLKEHLSASESATIQLVKKTSYATSELALKPCKIISHGERNTSGAKFDTKLTQDEVDLLSGSPNSHPRGWELALNDQQEVREETRRIETCRSNMFTAFVVVIAASSITIGCFALQEKLALPVVLFAVSLIFGLFIIGVLATIEKAWAINLRRGFLAALAGFLCNGKVPENYKGWSQLRVCFSECGLRRRIKACKRGLTRTDMEGESCSNGGRKDAKKLNYAKRALPHLHDSFTTFVSFVYGALYLSVIVGFAYSLKPLVKPWWDIPFILRLLVISCMMIITPLIQRFKNPLIASIVGFSIALMIAISMDTRYIGIIILGGTGFVLGALLWYLVRQMNNVRRGKYSFETSTYTWKRMFEECEPISERPQDLDDFRLSGVKRVCAYIYHYFLQ